MIILYAIIGFAAFEAIMLVVWRVYMGKGERDGDSTWSGTRGTRRHDAMGTGHGAHRPDTLTDRQRQLDRERYRRLAEARLATLNESRAVNEARCVVSRTGF